MKDMFVWRKSVYDNDFKCNQCGTKLFNTKTKQPTDNLVVSGDEDLENVKEPVICYCGKCQNAVATWQPVEGRKVGNNMLQGSYSEWIDKRAQDLNEEMRKRVEERISKKYEQKIKDLENRLKGKEETIKKLKIAYETTQQEKDAKIRKLYQELDHSDKMIEKLQNEVGQLLAEKLEDK